MTQPSWAPSCVGPILGALVDITVDRESTVTIDTNRDSTNKTTCPSGAVHQVADCGWVDVRVVCANDAMVLPFNLARLGSRCRQSWWDPSGPMTVLAAVKGFHVSHMGSMSVWELDQQ